MKKFPRVLCCLIFVLVFAVVILPEMKDDFAVAKSYAAENDVTFATTTANAEYPTKLTTTTVHLVSPDETITGTDVTGQWGEITTVANQVRISGIQIPDMTLIEKHDGWWENTDCNDCPEGECNHEYFHYSIYPQEEITVYFSDGTEFVGNTNEVYFKTGMNIYFNDEQSYDNKWSVGNSYYVTYFFAGVSTTVEISIIETPIESVELSFDKTEFVENIDGHLNYEVDENGELCNKYFHYNFRIIDKKITFKKGFEHYDDGNYIFYTIDNQSYDNPWGVGKHIVTISCLGYEEDFELEVIANPNKIKNVSVEPQKKLVKYIDGHIASYGNGEYFHYNIENSNPIINIEYEDGTVINVTANQFMNKFKSYLYFHDNQSLENPWGIGVHTAYITIFDQVVSFSVETVPHPYKIKNILVEADRKLVDVIDGYTDEQGNGHYNVKKSNPIITIEFEDGSVISGNEHQIEGQLLTEIDVISSQSHENQSEQGKLTAYLKILDKTIPFQVEVISCPVSEIELIKAPDKTEYIIGEYVDLSGCVIRVHYVSGDYFDVFVEDKHPFYACYFDEKMNGMCELHWSSASPLNHTTDKIVVTLGYSDLLTCEIPVAVKENKIESITIHNSENNELLITAYNSDGTTETMKVLSLFSDDGGHDLDNEMHTGGYLVTDKGIFWADLYCYYDSHYRVDFHLPGKRLESNNLKDCKWLDLFFKLERIKGLIFASPTQNSDNTINKNFCGEINENNIDFIVLASVLASTDRRYHLESVYDSAYITQTIDKTFVTDGADLSLSKNYNSTDSTIKIDNNLVRYRSIKACRPKYENGHWFVELICSYYDGSSVCDSVYIIFDDELRIVAYSINEMPEIEKNQLEIKEPTETVISYGDSIILHAEVSKLPAGGYIEWTASNNNFDIEVSEDGLTCKITPKSSGDIIFTATVYDKNGKEVSSDEQIMTSKAGFFDKIIAFFKKLFGLAKTIPQAFKGIY